MILITAAYFSCCLLDQDATLNFLNIKRQTQKVFKLEFHKILFHVKVDNCSVGVPL